LQSRDSWRQRCSVFKTLPILRTYIWSEHTLEKWVAAAERWNCQSVWIPFCTRKSMSEKYKAHAPLVHWEWERRTNIHICTHTLPVYTAPPPPITRFVLYVHTHHSVCIYLQINPPAAQFYSNKQTLTLQAAHTADACTNVPIHALRRWRWQRRRRPCIQWASRVLEGGFFSRCHYNPNKRWAQQIQSLTAVCCRTPASTHQFQTIICHWWPAGDFFIPTLSSSILRTPGELEITISGAR
jgi:hypothetical protein